MSSRFAIQTFYKFLPLSSYHELKPILLEECTKRNIKGTILLASEGINATIAGGFDAVTELVCFIQTQTPIGSFPVKHSEALTAPFSRMRVRVKSEIVGLGMPEVRPYEKTGTYVSWQEWNTLLDRSDIPVIDVRNDYEISIGTFENSINPNTLTFKEFPAFVKSHLDPSKNKKVAMCCTGGIRCEKASAYMLEQGFDEVFHLEGGILKYLEEVPAEQSRWQGDCFVFDDRVSVTESLEEGAFAICRQCYEAKPYDYSQDAKEFICDECESENTV